MSADYVDEDAIRHIPFLVLHSSEDGTAPVERSHQSVDFFNIVAKTH